MDLSFTFTLQSTWSWIFQSLLSRVVQMVKNPAAMWEIGVQSLGWEDPLEKRKAIYFSILAWGNPMARGAWRATVYGATKSQTRLSKKHFHTNSTESHLVLFFIFSARFFFFKIFLCGPFLKSLPNLVQYCSHCTFWFFGPEARGTLVPRPAIKPDHPALEVRVLSPGPPAKSLWYFTSSIILQLLFLPSPGL